ncbi:uncharacterized protein N7503_006782 [Penicillium pulvis]|uniref:uncharacterized protein n=1 Tax=Penicillium pulvis TaxID=1562058 RepID=UPI002548B289|nr:uncharacterized protein N7503_006782 [Penicillium pulvis]KAJ5797486.1 hypothetical protein N7503_006782 [Penicillium pulvis]
MEQEMIRPSVKSLVKKRNGHIRGFQFLLDSMAKHRLGPFAGGGAARSATTSYMVTTKTSMIKKPEN